MFKSKVTALKASKTRIYPSIRLPREYGEIIGNNAEVIPTSHEGKQAFLVVLDHESLNSESKSPLEVRLEAVENKLNNLEKTISEDDKKSGGPAEIRTQDPRRVKAMS